MDGLAPFDFALDPSQLNSSLDSVGKADISFERSDLDDDDEVSFVSKWRQAEMSAPSFPVQNSRISGLDDVYDPTPNQNQNSHSIIQNLDFQEPLTETQRLLMPHSPISPPIGPKTETESDHVVEVPDDREDDHVITTDIIEVIKKEIVEIRTTKMYFVKDRQVGQRTKIRVVENSQTIKMTTTELDQKLAKTDENLDFVTVEPETEPEVVRKLSFEQPKLVVEQPKPAKSPDPIKVAKPAKPETVEKQLDETGSDRVEPEELSEVDFTQLYIKDELMVSENAVGVLTRSSDDLNVGVRCFVKYDQFYYPAVVHELLGPHTSKVKVSFCDQMMSKAVSVDKCDILLITDLEVGMRTVARNIINKIEWVPCRIIAKYGVFRDIDLSDEYNRRLYSTRCGYRVEYTDTNDNTIICIVSLSDCAMEISDVPLETIQNFKVKSSADKAATNATKLDLENVILTPRRKSKKRSTVPSPSFVPPKRPRVEKRDKYIVEPSLVLPPGAVKVVDGNVLDFANIKQTKDTETRFITTSSILRCPTKHFFVSLLYNLEIVEWMETTNQFEPIIRKKDRGRLLANTRFEFTGALPNASFICEIINLAGGLVKMPTVPKQLPVSPTQLPMANVTTLDGMPIGEISLPRLMQVILEVKDISTALT